MKRLVVATNNNHKLKEIKKILGGEYLLSSLKDLSIDVEIDETGTTFYENALIKAKYISELTGLPALADDSGLVVDALNGEPGVYSARYAGEPSNDKKNNQKLLFNLDGKADRSAHFVSVIVVYYPNKEIVFAEGRVDGEILFEERGENGFGYDPLFYCKELNKTFAECDDDEKNSVSHRANALNKLKDLIV